MVNKFMIYSMSALPNRSKFFLEDELEHEPEFSYINLVLQEVSKQPKRVLPNPSSNLANLARTREKHPFRKSKQQNVVSRSLSRKKSKTFQRSQSKSKKHSKKISSKLLPNSKKQYKTIESKSTENKFKLRKSEKVPQKKNTLQSLFKRHQPVKKKKTKEQIVIKTDKKSRIHKAKEIKENRLQKSKSQNALDRITLSEISKEYKLGRQSKVIHEYFGIEDKLQSIVEVQPSRFKKDKEKDKSKTRSSASSVSNRKSKFSIKSGKVK